MFSLTAASASLEADLSSICPDLKARDAWPDITSTEFSAWLLYNSALTKYNDENEPSETAKNAALEIFLDSNARCKAWQLCPSEIKDDYLLGHFRKALWDFFHGTKGCAWEPWVPDLVHVVSQGGVGPGSSVLGNGTDFYTKVFSSPLSATSDTLHYIWERTVSGMPRWTAALQSRPRRYNPRLVRGSKLSFVNKKVDVARTIGTEPTINMWFQLGIGRLLEARLAEKFNFRLSDQQEVNAQLARIGSLTDDLVTLDLKSASDSVSLGMIEWAFEGLKPLKDLLLMCRSPVTQLPNKQLLELHMLSSMGNGYTFPLQTLLFSCVISAVYAFRGIPFLSRGPVPSRNVGVFGDDLICHVDASADVIRLLGLLGFRINAQKSFVKGRFRESCGADWFSGTYVRPVFFKRARTDQDLFVLINRLTVWTAHTGISLPITVKYLRSLLRGRPWQIPPGENLDAGIQLPARYADKVEHIGHGIREYRRWIPKTVNITVTDTGDFTLPESIDSKEAERIKAQLVSNPDGLLISFLGGYIRGCRFALRQRTTKYTTKPRITSYWDDVPRPRPISPVDWERRWYSAAEINLGLGE